MDHEETGAKMQIDDKTSMMAEVVLNANEFACGLALSWHVQCALADEEESNTLTPLFPIGSEKDREVALSVLKGRRERNNMFQIMAMMMEATYGISA
tara:strand:- start:1208 stop:1498 length:291 start_codon:yes stop_codon:yes gene_type:complete